MQLQFAAHGRRRYGDKLQEKHTAGQPLAGIQVWRVLEVADVHKMPSLRESCSDAMDAFLNGCVLRRTRCLSRDKTKISLPLTPSKACPWA